MTYLGIYNIDFEILIDDVQSYYISQNAHGHHHDHHDHHHHGIETRGSVDCEDLNIIQAIREFETPANYIYGSMGGYLTYSEALNELDRMAELYPDLISAKEAIGDIRTFEDRPIHWIRISDNPNVKEEEPEVLYTALHHAREPNSMAQMIFYMWYLLENYETDQEVRYLVDNTEMYFIPIVNPDGYVYNETTNPYGGGLWRKNRSTVDSIAYGIDLNRNYGYEWGFDNFGSSIDPFNDTYRGTEAFSEAETQAVRDFCNEHKFRITLNYHTFGNLLIYPWGYSDQVTEEHESFQNFARIMTADNNYRAGTGTETVGYTVNGDSDDWMYGDTMSKPKIYSLTPEAGPQNFGFWPPQSAIDGINKSNMLMNLSAAHLILNYGEVRDLSPDNKIMDRNGELNLNLTKYGLGEGQLELTFSSVQDNVSTDDNALTFDLEHLESGEGTFSYIIGDDVEEGELIDFIVNIDNGLYVFTDTITKEFSTVKLDVVYSDNASVLDNWTADDDWGITVADFVSDSTSITDSPNGDYGRNLSSTLTLNETIDLTTASTAIVKYFAKWDIEEGFDYVQIMASSDGVDYRPLCGKYTKNGGDSQDAGNPLYDGRQLEWVFEEVDLADYLGEIITLRFRLISDGYIEGDGFYFDDLSVEIVNDISSVEDFPYLISNLDVYPNPFGESFTIEIDLPETVKHVEWQLLNSLGQTVYSNNVNSLSKGYHKFRISSPDLPEGIYYLNTRIENQDVSAHKMIKF